MDARIHATLAAHRVGVPTTIFSPPPPAYPYSMPLSVQAVVGVPAVKGVKKVVLAYSGGLDTSIILKWLQDVYKCEVVTFTADLGQVWQGYTPHTLTHVHTRTLLPLFHPFR